ncbi:MAG: hypothetical protein GY916_10435, partial [Gammaproteobacteria bacterium]|nr:hypothetical protein [Gammaproteobacteria bacterium]
IATSDDPDTTTRTFTGLTVQDSGGVLNSGDDTSAASAVQTDITVVALNDAPVLSGSNNLADITEDAFTNSGTLVSALIAGHITDVDSGASEGIAVTGVDNSNGTWEYSINGGTNWNTLGSPSEMNARLLADDASTRVRFVPNTDYFGTVAGGITFRAWDQTTGNNGDEVNLSGTDAASDGFSTVSYSNNDGTTNWTSNWIEDDGAGGGASSGYFKINGGALHLELVAGDGGDNIYREVDLTGATTATLNFDFNNTLSREDEIRVRISGNGGSSYSTEFTFSGVANTGAGTANIDISSYIADDTRIQFYVFKNDAGQTMSIDNISVTYDNGDPAPGGETAFSAANASSNITVTPVNDDPTNAGTLPTDIAVTEDVLSNVDLSAIDLSDVDAASGNITVTLTTSTGGNLTATTAGGVTVGGSGSGVLTLDGTLTDLNTFLNTARNITYLHGTPDTNGDDADTIQINVNDNGNTGTGGGTDIDFGTVNVDIGEVNDAPTLAASAANDSLTENIDTTSAAVFSTVTIDPIESGDDIASAQLTIAGGIENTDTLTINGTAITNLGSDSSGAITGGHSYSYTQATGV